MIQATKPLTAKEDAAVEYYLNPENKKTYNNWEQSYLAANYKVYKGWERNAITVRHKPHVNSRIEARRAEIRTETGWSVKQSQEKLLATYKQATALNQPSAAVSAIVALNRTHNLDQPQPSAGAEPPLTETEQAVLKDLAVDYKRRMAVKRA